MKTIISLSARKAAASGVDIAKDLAAKRDALQKEIDGINSQIRKIQASAESSEMNQVASLVKELGFKATKSGDYVSIGGHGVKKEGSFDCIYLLRRPSRGVGRSPGSAKYAWSIVVQKYVMKIAKNHGTIFNPNAGKKYKETEAALNKPLTSLTKTAIGKAIQSAITTAKKLAAKPIAPAAERPNSNRIAQARLAYKNRK